METHRTVGLAAVLALFACEPYYELGPATPHDYVAPMGEVTPGGVAADYAIPKDAPRGHLRIASYGLVDVGSQAQSANRIQALHLRMTLTNNSDRAWTLDTREQRIDLEGYGTSVAAFASADTGSAPPTITVSPNGKRVVDLFFPLPTSLQNAEHLPGVAAAWQVQTGDEVVADRTTFDSMAVSPPATRDATYDYGSDYYWGPPYWYNPYYASYGFGIGIPFYYGYPLYVHHHDGYYGHFAHYGYYGGYGGYGGYYRGYPYGGHYGGYPSGGHYGGYPYGGHYHGYPYGGHYGGYPYHPQNHGYPAGGHGGHPGGGSYYHGGGGGHGGGGHGGGGGHR